MGDQKILNTYKLYNFSFNTEKKKEYYKKLNQYKRSIIEVIGYQLIKTRIISKKK